MIRFLRKLWPFIRPYRSRLILGLACGIIFALTQVALAAVIQIAVDFVFGNDARLTLEQKLEKAPAFVRSWAEGLSNHIHAPSSKLGVILVICLIPGVMFLKSLFGYLNIYFMNWSAVRVIADLRLKLFNHLQNLPLGFFHKASTGELISRVTADTQQLQMIVANSVASLVRDPLTIISLLIYLFSKQWKLTLLFLAIFPTCILPISIYGKKVRKSAKSMQTYAAEMSKVMHEAFTGNRIIKAYNLEDAVAGQFRQATGKYIGQIMRVVRANEIPGGIMEFLGSVGIALVLIYLVFASTQGIGNFFAFIGSIYLMYAPIKSLTRLHNQIHQAEAASERVFELLNTQSTIVEPATPRPLNAQNADIHFENIDFNYGEKPVLQGVNLTVKAGQMVALVGSSGSGKTTITNLLLRFYDPQRGSVKIGNTDIRDVSLKDLRRQIALVTQETILFHETIRRNIALGRPEATDAEVEAAARAANAHEFIAQKPEGYDAVVGEKGINVSGGQRQRIAIARAILKNAPILVLDEATSALDSESERIVQAELEKLMEGRTTLCIAHRLSTIQKADMIVVMSAGRIVETGTHAELLEHSGVYKRLYELHLNG